MDLSVSDQERLREIVKRTGRSCASWRRTTDVSRERIQQALSSRRGRRAFLGQLDIIVRAPVRIALRTWPAYLIGTLDEDDLVEEVFAKLFEDDGRDLARWTSGGVRWRTTSHSTRDIA